jgi:hypothetical protein
VDLGSKPAWASHSRDPTSKISRAKWTGGVAQMVGKERILKIMYKSGSKFIGTS